MGVAVLMPKGHWRPLWLRRRVRATQWAEAHNLRVVVVGAVEEEAATSKGARFIRDRFDGRAKSRSRSPVSLASQVVGRASHWAIKGGCS